MHNLEVPNKKTLQNGVERDRTQQNLAEPCRTLQNLAQLCKALQNPAETLVEPQKNLIITLVGTVIKNLRKIEVF